MVTVVLEYQVHTWARAVLDGPPNGRGLVEQSRGWPADLELPLDLLTVPDGVRRNEGATYGGSFVTAHGRLLVVSRILGADGSGRPGNYVTFIGLDPGRTVGALDLIELVRTGDIRLGERIEAEPDASADPLKVTLADTWPVPTDGESVDARSSYESLDEAAAKLVGATRLLPPDVVNLQPLWAGPPPPPVAPGPTLPHDDLSLLEQARARGWDRTSQWWERVPGADWPARARTYVRLVDRDPDQPIGDLLDAVDRYPEEHLRAVVLPQLAERFGEVAASDVDALGLAPILVPYAMASGPGQALDLIRAGAAAGLGDMALATLTTQAVAHGVSLDPLFDEVSAASDRILALQGISRPAPPAPEVPDPSPVDVTRFESGVGHDRHRTERVLDRLRAEAGDLDGEGRTRLKPLVSEAARLGATPEEVWGAAGSESLDHPFIKVSPAFAAYWIDVVTDDPDLSRRQARMRLRRHRAALVEATGVHPALGADYLHALDENRRLRWIVLAAAVLLLVSLVLAIVALLR